MRGSVQIALTPAPYATFHNKMLRFRHQQASMSFELTVRAAMFGNRIQNNI